MDKYLAKDIFAMVVSLCLGFLIGMFFFLINPYMVLFFYLAVGVGFAILVFILYAFLIRKPDRLIGLEKSLKRTAQMAKRIGEIARLAEIMKLYPSGKNKIGEVSISIAKLGDKIIRRELLPLEVQINRLERLAKGILVILETLRGEIRFSPEKMQEELSEITQKHIPRALSALVQLEVNIDKSEVKRHARAEEDLEVIYRLYENQKTVREAATMLRQLMTEKY